MSEPWIWFTIYIVVGAAIAFSAELSGKKLFGPNEDNASVAALWPLFAGGAVLLVTFAATFAAIVGPFFLAKKVGEKIRMRTKQETKP